jgi:hypothetical protein
LQETKNIKERPQTKEDAIKKTRRCSASICGVKGLQIAGKDIYKSGEEILQIGGRDITNRTGITNQYKTKGRKNKGILSH